MIKLFADWLVFSVFKMAPNTHLGEAAHFFVYDTIKIFLLLVVIIFFVSLVRTFFPPNKIRKLLSGRRAYSGNVLAALLGIITPFCTCSAIPLFIGFLEAGVPLSATFSFLVASPMINEVALVLLFSTFGWKISGLYVLSGLVISITSGVIIGKMNVEDLVTRHELAGTRKKRLFSASNPKWEDRIGYAKDYTFMIIGRVWLYVIIGIGLGSLIHGYVPTDFLARYASAEAWYAVPLAVLIGIPLYSNAAGIVPLVGVLADKGVAMGTILSFMMAVTGLSLPEFAILKKIMKTKLILIFVGVVGTGIVLTGFLFNAILGNQ